jgi:hypothetical protein
MDKQMRDAALRGDSSLDVKYTATEYVAINPAGVLFTRDHVLAPAKLHNEMRKASGEPPIAALLLGERTFG